MKVSAQAPQWWHAALDTARGVVDRRPRLIAFLTAAVAIAYGAGLTFRRATTPWATLPDRDYWGNIRGVITESGVSLDPDQLLRYNNEHIVAIPKLVYAANYLLTSGSNIGLIVYALVVGAACAILLVLLARDLLRDTPARWILCALLFPLAIFSAKLSHSYYFGMSGTIWLTADLLVIMSMAALAQAAKMRSAGWLVASLLSALLGVLAYSTAIYALLVLLIFCGIHLLAPRFHGRLPWQALAGVAAIAMASLAALLIYRPHPQGHPPLDFDPIGLAGFVLTYLGGSISNGYLQPVMGLVMLAAGALAIRRLLADRRGDDILLWVALFFFAPFNALMTGIGRLGFGLMAAMSSRYQSVTAISLIATIALLLAALPKEDTSRRSVLIRSGAIAALLIVAVFLATNRHSTKLYAKFLEDKPVAEIALRLGIAGEQHIRAATPAMNQFRRVLPALHAVHHVPFNARSRCENLMGESLPATSEVNSGELESMAAYPVWQQEQTAVELSGWGGTAEDAAECIAIVDGDGVVIGAGISGDLRLDPLTRREARIGWRAVATPPRQMPVCAFALFPGTSEFRPLANCKKAIDNSKSGLGRP